MSEHYRLEGKTVVPCDLRTWAKSIEGNHHVADETIGEARVSTVFLGLDHSFGGPVPILFETMVFGGALDGEQVRYTNWDDAERGHAEMCDRVRVAK